MNIKRLLILLACLLLYAAAGRAEDDITIKADSMSRDNQADDTGPGRRQRQDGVGGMTMTACRAIYNRETRILTAYEDVVIMGEDSCSGGHGNWNMASGQELYNATADVADSSLSLSGERSRNNDGTLILNTQLTTCEQPNPSWKFSAAAS